MSSVWDMILQWGSTIKVSIELPAATRHRRDMAEKIVESDVKPEYTHTPILLHQMQQHKLNYLEHFVGCMTNLS